MAAGGSQDQDESPQDLFPLLLLIMIMTLFINDDNPPEVTLQELHSELHIPQNILRHSAPSVERKVQARQDNSVVIM